MHGAEIYASNLNQDIEFVEEVEDRRMIYQRFPEHAYCITNVVKEALKSDETELIDKEYRYLLSNKRRRLIKKCLGYRKDRLTNLANKYDNAT